MRLLFVVCEEAAQVVLALVLLHQLAHLLVLRVLLEEGVRARDGALQVVQLGDKKTTTEICLRGFWTTNIFHRFITLILNVLVQKWSFLVTHL